MQWRQLTTRPSAHLRSPPDGNYQTARLGAAALLGSGGRGGKIQKFRWDSQAALSQFHSRATSRFFALPGAVLLPRCLSLCVMGLAMSRTISQKGRETQRDLSEA